MKTKLIRSAIPIYIAAAMWILYGLVLPLYKVQHIAMAAGLSIAAYLVAGRFFPGRTVEADLDSGDSQINQELKNSRLELEKITAAGKSIQSSVIVQKLNRMQVAGQEILSAVAQKPERASQVRKFMKYYLPTTGKLLEQYQTMAGVDVKGEHINKAMASVENSLDLIAAAFEKQLDQLYRDDAVDMTSDVQVLETMMAGDGLTTEGISQAMKEDKKQCQTN